MPLNVVYEPTTKNENILCYYADDLSLAYRTYYSRKRKEKEVIEHPPSRQCFYCNHFFTKKDVLEKHVKVCSSVTGIAYRFYNQKNRVFSKKFQLYGRFTVYSLQTTTGGSVIDDKKMYVISYCQVYAFHSNLKVPKILVFMSFQQDFNEITSLDHFFKSTYLFLIKLL